MLFACALFSLLAGLLHVFIFWLESFAWTTRARTVFGTSLEEAHQTREMAFNQRFYNLFLAVMALVGAGLLLTGHRQVGRALVVAGCGSMLAAALVLLLTSPDKRPAALKQGALPLAALLALLGSLL